MRKSLLSCRTVLVIATVVFCTIQANAADQSAQQLSWAQFRGRNGLGAAADGNYPTQFGPDKNVKWKASIPSGVSSPCIWNDRIFITAHDSDRDVLETICLSREEGSILWRQAAESKSIEKVHEVSSPANSTPATDGERVYVYFASFGLIAYDMDGEEAWRVPMRLRRSRFGSGTSPIVVDGLVILNRDGGRGVAGLLGDGPHILAVNAADGTTAWKTKRQGGLVHYSTPVLWRGPDGDQVLLMGSNRLTSYDLKSGKELWWIADLPPQVCSTPQVVDSHVYVSATGMFGEPESFVGLPDFAEFLKQHDKDEDGLIALDEIPEDVKVVDRRASGGAGDSPLTQFSRGIDRNRDKKLNEEEWNGFSENFGNFMRSASPGVFSIRLGGEGNVTKSNLNWHAKKGVAEVPSLLITSDRMFLVRNGGIVHCRDLKTGEDHYRGRLGAVGGYYASPVAGGGHIYFASDRGDVTVVAADAPKLEIVARNALEEPIMATPALADGTLFVRTESHLYAFRD